METPQEYKLSDFIQEEGTKPPSEFDYCGECGSILQKPELYDPDDPESMVIRQCYQCGAQYVV